MPSDIRTFIPNEKGQIVVNPAKQFVQPFELPTDAPNRVVTVAAGQQARVTATARYDGPVELFYVKAVVYNASSVPLTTYNMRWVMSVTKGGKRAELMNRPISLLASVGDGGRPYVLPETIFLPPLNSVDITFYNDDGAERQVELVFGAVKFYPFSAPQDIRREMSKYIERRERTYAYFQTTDDRPSIAASSVDQTFICTVPDDADLELFKLTCESTGTFRARIRDAANNRDITGGAFIHSSLLFGGHHADTFEGIGGSGGIFPYRWPSTWLVRRSTQIELVFNELSGATNAIEVVLGGRKIAYG